MNFIEQIRGQVCTSRRGKKLKNLAFNQSINQYIFLSWLNFKLFPFRLCTFKSCGFALLVINNHV